MQPATQIQFSVMTGLRFEEGQRFIGSIRRENLDHLDAPDFRQMGRIADTPILEGASSSIRTVLGIDQGHQVVIGRSSEPEKVSSDL